MADAKPLTLKDVTSQIEVRAALPKDIELPRPNHYSWWHPEFKKYVTFVVGKPFPWRDQLDVYAAFRDVDELRIYTVPGSGEDGKPKTPAEEWPLRRWVLSKRNMGCFECEDLTWEVFVQSVADEWVIVAEGMRTAERERASIVEFLLAVEGTTCAEAAVLIQDGIHAAPDEPEEPELHTNGASANGASAGASPDAGSTS
jgi:hypothetical protein